MKQLNFLDKNAINPLTTVGGAIAMKTQKLNVIFKSFRALALTALVVFGITNAWAASTSVSGSASGTVTDVLSWSLQQNSSGTPPVF